MPPMDSQQHCIKTKRLEADHKDNTPHVRLPLANPTKLHSSGFKIHPSDQGHFTFMPQANRWSYIKKQSVWETALFHRAAENTLQCICFCFLFTIISLCLPWQMWDWTLKCVVCLFPPQKSVSDSILNVLLSILVNRLAALNATLITNRCDTISN